ncbi:MAG: alpha/beta fold hydrolase [Pyrinomonadaceae bacterium]
MTGALESQDSLKAGKRRSELEVQSLLAEIKRAFAAKPFKPHPLFTNGHAQTLAGYAWPRRFRLRALQSDEEHLFEVDPGIRVLAHCRWQDDRPDQPTIVLWHGIEGSSDSIYMLGTADKAFRAGFNVVRMNVRNCGGTEHLTPTLYHGGLTEDLRVVIDELIVRHHLSGIFLAGFSLGGNMVLKLAGEYGDSPPREISGVATVSPSVDLNASSQLIGEKRNWIYHRNFVTRLQRRVDFKKELYPDLYEPEPLPLARTLREFDDRYTAPAFGFAGVDDYYARASSLPLIDRITIPTLIIHAQDDPFIPFAPLRDPRVTANPYVLLVAPKRGGHVGFVAASSRSNADEPDANSEEQEGQQLLEDRFWAENRVVEFCKLTNQKSGL